MRRSPRFHRNITVALGLKAVFLVTTVIGVTGLWPAILADTGAAGLATANAMRLRTIKTGVGIFWPKICEPNPIISNAPRSPLPGLGPIRSASLLWARV
ncbi:MAG: hypothetical protein EOR11_28700 [Mesorhizobium sp.]|nr:MAG: hypothetical protein EOR11_28700 [Mesorhizobium sp.]